MPIGTLYIVATPIGNLEDITLRALRILREADVIAAEDTRHTQKLLARYDIHTPLTSYHDHNKEEKAPVLVAKLLDGKSIALVSDAGTPGISDPGYVLINLAVDQKVPIVPIPGAAAAIAALSISGLPTDSFVFEGFLPSKHTARLKRLLELKDDKRTLVFYEAPHRILNTLRDMLETFDERQAVVTRELTKIHEESYRGALSDIVDELQMGTIKGEFTIVLHGAAETQAEQRLDTAEYLRNLMLHRGLSTREAAAAAAQELGIPKRAAYQAALKITRED